LSDATFIEVRAVHPENVSLPMAVTPLPILMDVRMPEEKTLLMVNERLLVILTEDRAVQPEKTLFPVMSPGIVTEVREVQLEKAPPPMDVTLLGIVMEVRAVQ